MPKIQNKWTTWAGLIVGLGTLITCAGQMMGGDMSAMQCLGDAWQELMVSAALLKASDGSL